jgi:DNA ligase (NAD+)
VAVFDPVVVAGSTISRATLHNQDEIDRLGVRIGDTVIIQKAGDVIPDIVKVIEELRPENTEKFTMPKVCPICGSNVIQKEGNVAYFCENKNCYSQTLRRLQHFTSKECFNIDGLGSKIVEQLLESGLIENEVDIFHLEQGDLEPLEKFAEKKAKKLIDSIHKSKEIVLSKFINSLAVLHIGVETAYIIAREIIKENKLETGTTIDLINYFKDKTVEEIQSIDTVGEKMAQSLFEFFNNKQSLEFLEKLNEVGIKLIPDEVSTGNENILNKTFVFTGTLSKMGRNEAKDLVKKLGGFTSDSVGKGVDYVVAGESAGSKLTKAQTLGITILSEEDFMNLLK